MKFACTFCGCPYAEARKLVSGFDGMICDVCVDSCVKAAALVREDAAPIMIQPTAVDLDTRLREYLDGRSRRFGSHTISCSFCGKYHKEVRIFFRGQVSSICSECVGLCIDMMATELGEEWTARQSAWLEREVHE